MGVFVVLELVSLTVHSTESWMKSQDTERQEVTPKETFFTILFRG